MTIRYLNWERGKVLWLRVCEERDELFPEALIRWEWPGKPTIEEVKIEGKWYKAYNAEDVAKIWEWRLQSAHCSIGTEAAIEPF